MLNYELLTPAVDRAASAVASNFPAHHDISDVKQELWVWIMENKNTVAGIAADSEGTLTALVELLMKAATSYLRKEDAQVYGYQQEDQFFYSADLIKSILEVIFRHEDWQSFAMSQDSQPRAKSEPALGGNNLASYADVSNAVDKLPTDYYNLIVWRYKYQRTFDQIAADTAVDRTTAFRRHERAVKAIQALLGQQPLSEFRKGYDGRQVNRRNENMTTKIESDYSG